MTRDLNSRPMYGAAPPAGAAVVSAATALRCPHGGLVVAAGADRADAVRVDGAALVTTGDTFTVQGCPHHAAGRPRPCTTVRWGAAAHHAIRVDGLPLLPAAAGAQCLSAGLVPQGAPVVVPGSARGVTSR